MGILVKKHSDKMVGVIEGSLVANGVVCCVLREGKPDAAGTLQIHHLNEKRMSAFCKKKSEKFAITEILLRDPERITISKGKVITYMGHTIPAGFSRMKLSVRIWSEGTVLKGYFPFKIWREKNGRRNLPKESRQSRASRSTYMYEGDK